MTERQRYVDALLFRRTDRIPLQPQSGRRSTREAWRRQGLPETVPDDGIAEYAYRQVGGAEPWPSAGSGFPVNTRMIPEFEEKVIEARGDTQIVQDWKGNICEISSRYTPEYLRHAIDFVTRRWLKCPVESRRDWQGMKRRYDPAEPARYPESPERLGEELSDREWPIVISVNGPFWQLREWLGFEGLCLMLYDDPDFVRDMIEFWDRFVLQVLENTFPFLVPDEVHVSEDMAYKSFSMISPAMVKGFLFPTWKRWGELVREAGVPLYGMDSDGFIGELIPLWIEAGFNCCDPIEAAAGNDLVGYRRRFARKMAYRGGVDKRAMAKGGDVLEAEFRRLLPVIRDGGYIPSCDHGIPPDVSWSNYLDYVRLLAEATGWLDEPAAGAGRPSVREGGSAG